MANKTINYYNTNASMFTSDTISADMSDAQLRFLSAIQTEHPGTALKDLTILDFGCGTGRDTKYFLDRGYTVAAIDGSKELAQKASDYTGIHVKTMLFQDFHDENRFDGVWACASILHLSKNELPSVMNHIVKSLKAGGIIYTSFKYGNFEGYRGNRYYTDLDEQSLNKLISQSPSIRILEQWISSDVRPERNQEKWINIIAVKENDDC